MEGGVGLSSVRNSEGWCFQIPFRPLPATSPPRLLAPFPPNPLRGPSLTMMHFPGLKPEVEGLFVGRGGEGGKHGFMVLPAIQASCSLCRASPRIRSAAPKSARLRERACG